MILECLLEYHNYDSCTLQRLLSCIYGNKRPGSTGNTEDNNFKPLIPKDLQRNEALIVNKCFHLDHLKLQ